MRASKRKCREVREEMEKETTGLGATR